MQPAALAYALPALGAGLAIALQAAAAPPCGLGGITVGDRMTPEQIMKAFGVANYRTLPSPTAGQEFLQHMSVVGLDNAVEEQELERGANCTPGQCSIPFGLPTLDELASVKFDVTVAFDRSGIVKQINLSYALEASTAVQKALNTKFGDDWREERYQIRVLDPRTGKSEPTTASILYHNEHGKNLKTGDSCTILVMSDNEAHLRTTGPAKRSKLWVHVVDAYSSRPPVTVLAPATGVPGSPSR